MVNSEILASLEGEGGLSAEELLERLGLGGLPSQETLFNEIEESLLLPKTRLPDHWLGTYQVYVLSRVLIRLLILHRVTGITLSKFPIF
jgi:hypothetical protein